jgi:hypothetical protein
LFISVNSKAGEDSLFSSLEEIRAHKFPNNNTTELKLLLPTKDAFLQHLNRVGLATIIDKTAHLAEPNLPSVESYGWTLKEDTFIPTTITTSAWPEDINKRILCGCISEPFCNRNCASGKQSVACYNQMQSCNACRTTVIGKRQHG